MAVAEYFREAITDAYFFRGYRIPEDEIIQAMNVADDWLVLPVRNGKTRPKVSKVSWHAMRTVETAGTEYIGVPDRKKE